MIAEREKQIAVGRLHDAAAELMPREGGPCCRKMTLTSSRRGACRHRAGARHRGAAAAVGRLGIAEIDRAVSARSRGRATTSSKPPWPRAKTFGTPASGGDSLPSRVTMRMRPGRSVTSMRPSGRKASDHGCTRPLATVSTAMSPAEVGKVGGCGAYARRRAATTAQQSISDFRMRRHRCDIAARFRMVLRREFADKCTSGVMLGSSCGPSAYAAASGWSGRPCR